MSSVAVGNTVEPFIAPLIFERRDPQAVRVIWVLARVAWEHEAEEHLKILPAIDRGMCCEIMWICRIICEVNPLAIRTEIWKSNIKAFLTFVDDFDAGTILARPVEQELYELRGNFFWEFLKIFLEFINEVELDCLVLEFQNLANLRSMYLASYSVS